MTTLVQSPEGRRLDRAHITRFLRNAGIGLVGFYGIAITIILAAWLVIGERYVIISMVVAVLSLLLLPSVILLPLLLLLKRWRLAMLVVAPFVTFIVVYGAMFLPRSIAVPAGATQIRLLTYNLHAERNILEPMIANIRDANADIVALQEMSPAMSVAIDKAVADLYPYRALFPSPDGVPYHGRGILSRYPIVEDHVWPVEYPIPVRLQRAVLNVQGTMVTLYNFHAPPSQPIYGQGFDVLPRKQQFGDLLAMIAQDTTPILLMCDCNTYDLDQNYRRITAVLHDTYREVGWGMGYTNPDWSTEQGREGPGFIPPHQRPDYIFHDDHFVSVEARVWDNSGGSDHRPVYALLALKPA